MSRTDSISRIFSPLVFLLAIGLGPFAVADNGSKPADDQNQAGTSQSKPDQAATDTAKTTDTAKPDDQSGDPLKRPLEQKHKEKNARAMKRELSDSDRGWLERDVPYIITSEERKAFMQLSNEEEREQFIESFWDRRNPNPDSELKMGRN